MADVKNDKPSGTPDWRDVEEHGIDFELPDQKGAIVPSSGGAIFSGGAPSLPTELELPRLDFSPAEGFIQKWKMDAVKKRAAVEGTKKVIESQLKVLGVWLDRVVMAEDARAENALKKCLAIVNAERLRIMRELGMANLRDAEQFMIDQTDQHLAILATVWKRGWPDKYKRKVTRDMETLWMRLNEEVMDESGSKFLKD